MPPRPIDHPTVQIFEEIRRIDRGVRAAVAKHLPPGVSFAQYEVLSHLDRRGDGLTPAEIARAVQAPKSGLTNTLQRLEDAGLVRVEPCGEDGRRKRVWLTDAGREVHSATVAGTRPRMEHLREAFTIDEFRAALPFLKALRAWFDEKGWD